MHKLLILLLLFQSGISFCQVDIDTYHDLVNRTVVNYTTIEEKMSNPDLDLLEEVDYIQLKSDHWPGVEKINTLIHNQLNELKTPEFAVRFEREYAKALKLTLIDWHRSCVEESGDPKNNDCGHYSDFSKYFTPDQLQVEFLIIALCDHILIGGMNVSFNAAREQDRLSVKDLSFQDLHYYDLIQGVEIDPSTILDKRKLPEFHKLIKSRVPEHLRTMADTLDFNKGLPLFNGASFYYFIEGNIETYSENQSILQIRLSLEDVSPFLNVNGPFKAYVALKPANAKHNGLMYDEVHYYGIHPLKEVQSLRAIDRLTESLSGKAYANKTVYINSERASYETQITFNKLGNPTNKKTIIKEKGKAADSIAYIYHSNGKLKAINHYDLETLTYKTGKRDELVLVQTHVFDEQQNLIKRTEYHVFVYHPEDIETSIDYYSYFDERVITDASSETNYTSSYEWGATEYLINDGAAMFFQDNDQAPKDSKYTTRTSSDTTFIEFTNSNKTEAYLFYITKNNRVIEFMEQHGHLKTEIGYDNSQRPISYASFRRNKTGFAPYTSSGIEYDSKNRPVKYSYQFLNEGNNPNRVEVYELRYE